MHGFHTKKRRAKGYADGGNVEEDVKRSPESEPLPEAQSKQSESKSKPIQPEALGNGLAYKAGKALQDRQAQIDAAAGYADGGMIRGAGTGTSDDIKAVVPTGSYIMPADSTKQIGEQALSRMGKDVPVNLSNGEYQMPPEQVHAVGVQALDQLKNQTHTPVAAGFSPGAMRAKKGAAGGEPELFFADGGQVGFYVDDEGRVTRQLPSQSREVVAVNNGRNQVATTAQPQASTQAPFLRNAGSLPPPAAPLGLPPPEPRGQTDFYTNKAGTTNRGFGVSSSTDLVPAGDLVDKTPRLGLPAPAQPAPVASPSAPTYDRFEPRARAMHNAKADTASYLAEKAAQDARFANAASPAAPVQVPPQGFMSRALRAAGPLGAAISAVPEVINVARVAADPNSTKIDVTTQGAEAAGRLGAAGAGAALGAKGGAALGTLGGPFAPVTVPAGAAIGSIAGGALGYFGADKAIDYGRSLFGSDTESPVDRIQQAETAPAVRTTDSSRTVQAQTESPFDSPTVSAAVPSQQPINTQEQVAPQDNNVTRVGNSFSGRNIREGYTINGAAPGLPAGFRSAQNQRAVDALFDRTPDAILNTAAQQVPAAPSGFRPNGGVTVIRDSQTADRDRQRLIRAASTPHEGAQNGQLTAAQLATLRSIDETGQRINAEAELNAENNAARSNQAAIGEAGANTRAAIQEYGQNMRAAASNELEGQRLADAREVSGFQSRALQRIERLYEQYDKAKPEDRAGIAEQINQLSGKSQAQNRFTVVPGGQEYDPQAMTTLTRPSRVFNNQTGQFVDGGAEQSANAPTPPDNHIQALKNNPSLAAQFDARYGQGAAQRYMGNN